MVPPLHQKDTTMPRATFIDPFEKTVTEIEHSGHHLDITKILQMPEGHGFDCTVLAQGSVAAYYDDEGLFVPDQKFFQFHPTMQPIGGRCICFGLDMTGDNVDTPFILERVREGVTFPDIRYATMTTLEGKAQHPILGEMHQITSTAHFVNPDGTPYHYGAEIVEDFADSNPTNQEDDTI